MTYAVISSPRTYTIGAAVIFDAFALIIRRALALARVVLVVVVVVVAAAIVFAIAILSPRACVCVVIARLDARAIARATSPRIARVARRSRRALARRARRSSRVTENTRVCGGSVKPTRTNTTPRARDDASPADARARTSRERGDESTRVRERTSRATRGRADVWTRAHGVNGRD
jgi:hypothetical protein